MLVVMSHTATNADIDRVVGTIREMGYDARPIPGKQRTAIGLIGNDGKVDSGRLESLPGVLQVIHVTQPYKQVSREWRPESTVINLENGTRVGGGNVTLMAGPCSVESEGQILGVAQMLRDAGATVLRGGAFKPRTSPYAFQGLGLEGLKLLARARAETGLAIVTEVLESELVDLVAEYADILQIGARNMQNYPLLRRAGKCGKPVLLKRGLAATIKELLLSAEYILAEGNGQVILCERGIRGFDENTRNILDLAAVPVIQSLVAPAHHCRSQPRHWRSLQGRTHGARRRRRRRRWHYRRGAPRSRIMPCPTALSHSGRINSAALVRQIHDVAHALGRGVVTLPTIYDSP